MESSKVLKMYNVFILIKSAIFLHSDLAVALSDACLIYYDNAYIMYKSIEYTKQGVAHKILNNLIRCMIITIKFDALESLTLSDRDKRQEAIKVGEEMISLFDEIGVWHKNDPYCQEHKKKPSGLEIDTCQKLARLHSFVRDEENNNKVLLYSQRAIDLCHEAGKKDMARQIQHIHDTSKAKFSRKYTWIREEHEFAQTEAKNLPDARESYEYAVSKNGENSAYAITCGRNLALVLLQSG